MLAAMVEEVAERGAVNVTVAHVVGRSGVSRRTFYELFEDREDCLLAALEEGIGRVAREVAPAYQSAGRTQSAHGTQSARGNQRVHGWRERVRAGLIAGLSFLEGDPGLARLLVVESLGAGPRALERRSRVLARLIDAVDKGRSEANAKPGSEPPSLTAEGVVGAVLAVLHGRLLACPPPARGGSRVGEGRPGPLVELTNPLMGMIVLPYLGAAAARRELDRPVPRASAGASRRGVPDPLRELEMRLTYRTVRVLMAVAGDPGSSNRGVADGAGISDQGQISKLLARLQGLGLIENTGTGPERGAPNAWTLTAKGWEVHGAITQQAGAP
jgi:AcrR family transcriptional regulator